MSLSLEGSLRTDIRFRKIEARPHGTRVLVSISGVNLEEWCMEGDTLTIYTPVCVSQSRAIVTKPSGEVRP